MELYTDLQEDINLKNEIEGFSSSQSLFHIYSDIMQESALIGEHEVVEINSMQNEVVVSGFSRDLERYRLNIFVTDYSPLQESTKIYSKDLERYFSQYLDLFMDYLKVNVEEFDRGDPIIELSDEIHKRGSNYTKVIIWHLTNNSYSSRKEDALSKNQNGLDIEFKPFDLNSYSKLLKDKLKSDIHIQSNIDALQVIDSTSYTSYLFSLSGLELVSYYDEYGKALLESNVRTFLSLKRKVNRGIYNTITSEIDRPFFFAYNNGITATASEVVYTNGKIVSIKDLQIVNGGQTISTLYNAWKGENKPLDQIFVQVKLSVIHVKKTYSDFVGRISRYANTQNKVNESDFFGSSYYHKKMKSLSKTIRVDVSGSMISQKWFYERLRGEYQNDQMYKKDSQKKAFLKEYPKTNVFDKIAVSKAYLSVEQHPHLVSKGAQLCFAEFAKRVSDLYEEGSTDVNEYLFKKNVAQVILFRSVEKLVGSSDWYTKGYRAQTVAYTIAIFNKLITENQRIINWLKIWDNQEISSSFLEQLDILGSKVHRILINPPEGETNIGTYCKKIACWNRLKDHSFQINLSSIAEDIDSVAKEKERKTSAKKQQKMFSGIEAQMEVLRLVNLKVGRVSLPDELVKFYNGKYAPGITDVQRNVLKSWSQGRIGYPSEKQAQILIKLLQRAEQEGFRYD